MFQFIKALNAPLSRSIRASVLFTAFALIFVFTAISVNAQDVGTPGQTTAFTYQGHLTESINSPSGPYDFQFAVFDLAGNQQGPLQTIYGVSVANGVFTVSLDFGSAPFAVGEDRYLEIRVKKLPAVTYTVLSPRQRITSVPYAIRSISAASADIATTVPDGAITSSKLASNLTLVGTTTGTFSGNGSGLTGIPVGPTGPQGPQGPQGVAGPIGPIGPNGATGPTGAPGLDGPIGPQGPQGTPGNVGSQGPVGPTGQNGATGATGPQGTPGNVGPQGPVGPTGQNGANGLNASVRTTAEPAGANCATGGFKTEFGTDTNGNGTLDNGEVNAALTRYVCNGSQGATGANGAQGVAGSVGPAGATGVAGAQGPQGPSGAIGATGPQGLTGATGATGATGPIGPAGTTGATGANGAQGPAGPQGASGIVSMTSISGSGANPSGTTAFLAQSLTIAVASTSQKVLVTSHKAFGSAVAGGGLDLNLYICYQVTGGTLTPVGGGVFGLQTPQNTRNLYGLSTTITGLAAGTYTVGLCGLSNFGGSWNNNEYSYTTAIVSN